MLNKKKLEFFIHSANTEDTTCTFCNSWQKNLPPYNCIDIIIGYINQKSPNLISCNINLPDIHICKYCLRNLSKRITVSDNIQCFKCNGKHMEGDYKLCTNCYYELNHKLYIVKLKSILL